MEGNLIVKEVENVTSLQERVTERQTERRWDAKQQVIGKCHLNLELRKANMSRWISPLTI